MKTIRCWNDLERYGIVPLTGEACGLMYRILCDVTDSGKRVLEKCLGVHVELAEAWNRGTPADPHVGSLMLAPEMLTPLGVFALLESGCPQVWLVASTLIGIEAESDAELAALREIYEVKRTFGYRGTAGDRNVHVMTGRVR